MGFFVVFFFIMFSSLVCMVGITYAYTDMAVGCYEYFIFTHIYCLVGC